MTNEEMKTTVTTISDEFKSHELKSTQALNDIALELLRHKKSDHTKMFVIIILLIIMNIVQCAIFIWYINRLFTICICRYSKRLWCWLLLELCNLLHSSSNYCMYRNATTYILT